jgi:hypothetical protein
MEEGLDITQDTTTVEDNSSQESEINLEEEISKALEEPISEEVKEEEKPEENVPPVETKKQDNTEKCPVKFQNEDGTVNVGNLLKSYKELEPLLNEKNSWQKERAELLKAKEELDIINKEKEAKAQQAGYESAEDMKYVYDLAYTEANEYAKYLQYVDDPEEVRSMLINYANNPRPELMEQIELEFAPDINKRVAIASDRFTQNYQAQQEKVANDAKFASIESVVKQSVESNKEIFNYEPFKNLFINTLDKYGNNFSFEDAQALIGTMVEMRDLFRAEFAKEQGLKIENDAAKDKIAAIDHSYSAPSVERYSNEDINRMSPEELNKAIRKFI